jgi:heme-degrading monooxygenase HmoA
VILELAILDIIAYKEAEFEKAFVDAEKIITTMRGYISHSLQKCIEKESRYVLLVEWETLEDHTQGFRKSEEYQKWKELLHHFYDPFPVVEHYKLIEQRNK